MLRADMPDRMPRDDAGLKALAKMLGCAKKDLLVLAPGNDPYNMDTPAKRRDAEWFYGLWEQFGYSSGVHVRRVHYHASVKRAGEIMLPSGECYLNNEECWTVMANAAVAARDLGIINPTLFEDRRNPKTKLFASQRYDPPDVTFDVLAGGSPLGSEPGWYLPRIWSDLSVRPFGTGQVQVSGYDYHDDDQPYLLELWIEKSTMDDVLVPLCRRLCVNYTPGLGFTSRTRVAEMLQRARAHRKPVRVFVIADFDPAGSKMPASMARVVEFYRDQMAPGVEIALHYIGMTRDWAERYDLPRAPIKEKDRRKGNFEKIHGEGCVELDALEVLHEGALAAEVERAIAPYRDARLEGNLHVAERAASEVANAEWHAITAPIRAELDTVRASINAVTDTFRDRLAELDGELQEALEPQRQRLRELWGDMEELAGKAEIDLPARPAADAAGADESGWLYHSRRHWRDQLDVYRRITGGGGDDD